MDLAAQEVPVEGLVMVPEEGESDAGHGKSLPRTSSHMKARRFESQSAGKDMWRGANMRIRRRAPDVALVGKELFWTVVILLGGLWTAGYLAAVA